MTLADAIYQHSLKLPERAAREALDFIEFLEQRYASGCETVDAAAADDAGRREALAHLSKVRIPWRGKPIADREALYDDIRGNG